MAATHREVALGSLPYARDRRPRCGGAAAHRGTNRCDQPRHRADRRRLAPPARCRADLVEDVGHLSMIEAPDRFNAVLGTALASFGS
jgi:pimeloyl-ACP methyl ester carboxylesterase